MTDALELLVAQELAQPVELFFAQAGSVEQDGTAGGPMLRGDRFGEARDAGVDRLGELGADQRFERHGVRRRA